MKQRSMLMVLNEAMKLYKTIPAQLIQVKLQAIRNLV